MRADVCTYLLAIPNVHCGKKQNAQVKGIIVRGGFRRGGHQTVNDGQQGISGMTVAAKGGAQQQQGLEMTVNGAVLEPKVVKETVSVQLLHVGAVRRLRMAVEDAAAKDGKEIRLKTPDKLRLKDMLQTSLNLHVGDRIVVQLHHDFIAEHRKAERQADAGGPVVYLDDRGLAVLEDATLDVYALHGGRTCSVRHEGEAVMALYEKVEQRLHLRTADLYRGAGLRTVVKQVETAVPVPVATGQVGDLGIRGTDEDKAVETVAKAVVIGGGLLRFKAFTGRAGTV